MIAIPTVLIVILGLTACARELYRVARIGKFENVGTLFAFGYITVVYIFITWGVDVGVSFHGSLFVRLGIFLIVLDKVIAFAYEIYLLWKNKWKTT